MNLQSSSDDDGLSKSLLLLKSFSKTLSSPSPRGPIFYGKSKLHLSLQIKKRAKIQKMVDFFVSTIPIRKSPSRFCTQAQKEKKWEFFLFKMGILLVQKGTKSKGLLSELWIWHKTIFSPLFTGYFKENELHSELKWEFIVTARQKFGLQWKLFDSVKASLTFKCQSLTSQRIH